VSTRDSIETEIKLRAGDLEAVRALIERAGFQVSTPRALERNTLFDTPSLDLRGRDELVRIRDLKGKSKLTFKGRGKPGRHKVREELESALSNGPAVETIFERLGFKPVFRYEKYRTEYSRNSDPGTITVDETPIGNFLELEGPEDWIDATARQLGFGESDYVLASYGALYLEYCQARHIEPADMVF
jgi:adenylate cyclase class 2